jgi:hypothetical protein
MKKESAFLAPSYKLSNNQINSMIQLNPIEDEQQLDPKSSFRTTDNLKKSYKKRKQT